MLASLADSPEERAHFDDMAVGLTRQTRQHMAPAERQERAMEQLAEAKVRRQRAERHLKEAQDQLDRSVALELQAQEELDLANEALQDREPQRSQERPPAREEWAEDVLATLQSGASFGQNGMVVLTPESYRQLAAKLGVSEAPPQQQQPSHAPARAQQGPVPPGGRAGATGNNSFAAFDTDDDEELLPAADEELQVALRSSLHPTAGKRQSRKGRRQLKETIKKKWRGLETGLGAKRGSKGRYRPLARGGVGARRRVGRPWPLASGSKRRHANTRLVRTWRMVLGPGPPMR